MVFIAVWTCWSQIVFPVGRRLHGLIKLCNANVTFQNWIRERLDFFYQTRNKKRLYVLVSASKVVSFLYFVTVVVITWDDFLVSLGVSNEVSLRIDAVETPLFIPPQEHFTFNCLLACSSWTSELRNWLPAKILKWMVQIAFPKYTFIDDNT